MVHGRASRWLELVQVALNEAGGQCGRPVLLFRLCANVTEMVRGAIHGCAARQGPGMERRRMVRVETRLTGLAADLRALGRRS